MKEAPYPSDTRARGWRLEIDHERIDQSDTWALAEKPGLRPWLLLLWLVAWKQTPCGSLPPEDDLIAARLGMAPGTFAKHRSLLMRGWWQADDGRLYHKVLVQRVQEMLVKRAKDAERAAKSRANNAASQANPSDVTRDTNVTHKPPTREFDTKHQAPDTGKEKRKDRAPAAPACPSDVPPQVFADWVALRKAKRAPVTQTTLDGAVAEAERAALSLAEFLRIWCTRGSQWLQADWLKPDEIRAARHAEPKWRREQRERVLQAVPGIAARFPNTVDVEAHDVTAKRLG